MPIVVTLVHGTFGRLPLKDAGWTGEGSLLRQKLRAELGDDIVFLPFRWSGMNWPAARYGAARRLRAHFRDVAAGYPDHGHYVVSHSHGGNVVLYALRDARSELGDEPHGAICLSTPFIAAQPRRVTLFRFVATYAVLLVTLFAILANVVGRLLPRLMPDVDPSDTVVYALVTNEVWLEFLVCAALAWYATNGLVTLARRRHEKIAVDSVRAPIRIYRSIGDEATALLATSSFFSWLATLAWSVASALTIGVAGIFSALILAPALLLLAGALPIERLFGSTAMRRRLDPLARSRRFWTVVVTLGTLAAFAMWGYFLAGTPLGTAEMTYAMFVAGLVLAVIFFSTISGLGYGLTAPFLEVTAEATPVGSWQVHLFAARGWDRRAEDQSRRRLESSVGSTSRRPDAAAKPAALAHSAAYVDDGVLGDIAVWIREREGVRSQACP